MLDGKPAATDRIRHPWFYWWVTTTLRILLRVFCRLEVHGRENIPKDGPFILASNHNSYIDPPLISVTTRRPLSYIAMEGLFRVPVLGPAIRWLNAIPVRRDGGDRAALRKGLEVLRDGRGLLVYPEGMRSPDGQLLQPKLGIGFLALRSGAPVIPVGLVGGNDVLPVGTISSGGATLVTGHRKLPRPAKCRVFIGTPLTFEELRRRRPTQQEDMAYVAKVTMEAIAELTGRTFEWQPDAEWWHAYRDHPTFVLTMSDTPEPATGRTPAVRPRDSLVAER